MKKFLTGVDVGLIALLVLVGVLVGRTMKYMPETTSVTVPAPAPLIHVDPAQTAAHLSRAIRFKTVSTQDRALFDPVLFKAFQDWLGETYPSFYASVDTELVLGSTQLNIWQGSDASLDPVLFLAHQDVVPADEGEGSGWEKPPFSGLIEGGFIWGRGAIDDKGSLIALLEAADRLAASGYQPKRTIIFGFGHDEEVGGTGAQALSKLFKERDIHPWAVIDEGGAITTNMPDVAGPVARIGVAEKGYLTLSLTSHAKGGHSSTPPKITALGELSRAIAALEATPFTQKLDPVLIQMLHATARSEEVGFGKRLILSNLWLFGGLVEGQMKKSNSGAAMLGTTIAPTILNAGIKENALPREATALVNFRLAARDSVAGVVEHVKNAINNPNIDVVVLDPPGNEPSPVSQIGTGPYAWLESAVHDGFPDTLVAPNVVLGGTDSRYFAIVTDDIYRFAPYTFDSSDFSRIHGLNERMGVEDFAHGVQVYYLLLERAGDLVE
jgi:carboxypeptidase PM20D1